MIFLKRGAAAKQAVQEEDAKAEERGAPNTSRMRRFYIGYNEDSQITFLDGKLDEDGVLDFPRFYEHKIQVGGDWKNFVCTAEIDTERALPDLREPATRRRLVGVMTVIDHSTYTVKKGPNAGKTYHEPAQAVRRQGRHDQAAATSSPSSPSAMAWPAAPSTSRAARRTSTRRRSATTFDFVDQAQDARRDRREVRPQARGVPACRLRRPRGEIVYLPPAKLIELGIGKAHGGVGLREGRQRRC